MLSTLKKSQEGSAKVERGDSIRQNVIKGSPPESMPETGRGLYPSIPMPKSTSIIHPMQEILDNIINDILNTKFPLANDCGPEITYLDPETGDEITMKVPKRVKSIYDHIRPGTEGDSPSQESAREKIEFIKNICCPDSSNVTDPSPVVSTVFYIPTTKKETIDFLKKTWTSCERALKPLPSVIRP